MVAANGSSPGSITMTGDGTGEELMVTRFSGTQTLLNMTLTFDHGETQWSAAYTPELELGGAAGETVTLGADFTVKGGYGVITYGASATVNLVNDGSILANHTSGARWIMIRGTAATTWTNNGSIEASLGNGFYNYSDGLFTNSASGSISVIDGGTLVLGPITNAGTFVNQGSITASGGSLVKFYGNWSNPSTGTGTVTLTASTAELFASFETDDLTSFSLDASSGVRIYGVLDNSAGTLDLDSFGALAMYGGTISGGTLHFATPSDLTFQSGGTGFNATFDGVEVQGDISFTGQYTRLNFTNGAHVVAANGSSPGSITMTGDGTGEEFMVTRFSGTQTLSNMTLTFDHGETTWNSAYTPELELGGAAGETVTLGADFTVEGGYGVITYGASADVNLVNDGSILANYAGGGRWIHLAGTAATTWTNNGLIEGSLGNHINVITAGSFENSASGVLQAVSGGDIYVIPAFNSAGIINVSGAGSTATFSGGVTMTGGTLGGDGTIIGNIIVDGGQISPANSTGTLTHTGDVTFNSGSLLVELEGTAAGSFDLYAVSGNATFDAGVILFDFNSFTPTNGDSFIFMTAASGYTFTNGDVAHAVLDVEQSFDFSLLFGANDATFTALNGDVAGSSTLFFGSSGADNYTSGAGDDVLDGGLGDDILSGEAGADRIDGGDGADQLTGGADNDVFIFDIGDDADTVTDFVDGVDLLDVIGHGASDVGDFTVSNNGTTSVIIDFGGGDQVTLNGSSAITIDNADFIFS